MKTFKKILASGLLAIAAFALTMTLLSFDYTLPKGWFKAGDKPGSYEMGIDKNEKLNANKMQKMITTNPNDLMVTTGENSNAATIKSIDKKIDGFGTLMQDCVADKFLGKRVRMTGYMKTANVSDWAAFWFIVDTKEGERNMPFDNMHDGKKDRSIKGTTGWTKYEIVLDVPNSAENLAYGALLAGTGQIWFTDLNFEIVDKSVLTTGMGNDEQSKLKEPTNLNFEE